MFKYLKVKHCIFVVCCLLFICIAVNLPYTIFFSLGNDSIITNEELQNIKSNLLFNANIQSVNATEGSDIDEYLIKYKLFNLFNITSLKVKVHNGTIYPGGNCLGFAIQSKGVVVIGSNYIITSNGSKNPVAESGIKSGDIILEMDGTQINCVSDITNYLKTSNGETISMLIKRDNQTLVIPIQPVKDMQSDTFKLGLWLKEDALGIGTLTYVDKSEEDYVFGALGHAITDSSGNVLEITSGDVYEANVVGVKKGERGTPGELLGVFTKTNLVGEVDKNTFYGVFGDFDNDQKYIELSQAIPIGGRLTAKPGKAKILSCIDGYNIEEFNIEIIKTNFQSSPSQKSMVIRVTDEKLLEKTGGIVQGMSGSPIIQDGKLIGAVTHVFVNDPTKGFGIYLDWMINV